MGVRMTSGFPQEKLIFLMVKISKMGVGGWLLTERRCAGCRGKREKLFVDVHSWSEAGLSNHAAGPLPTEFCLLD